MAEKNRHTLIQILQQLKIYQPPAKIWEKVEETLNEKEKTQTKLPKFLLKKAPIHIWDQLNDALDYEANEVNREVLKENVEKLPLYRPPINHWYNIEVGLEQHERRKLYQKRKYIFSSAAAILLLGLVFSAFMWISFKFMPKEQMHIAEKAMSEFSRIEEGELVLSKEVLLQLLAEELTAISQRQDTIQAGSIPVNINPRIDLSVYIENISIESQDEEFLDLKKDLKKLNIQLQKFVELDSMSLESPVLEHFITIEKKRALIIEAIIEKL